MLDNFDWLRRCRTGTELLATLCFLSEDRDYFQKMRAALAAAGGELGPPVTALAAPCPRCGIYRRTPTSDYCPMCTAIFQRCRGVAAHSRRALVVWGYTDCLPRQIEKGRDPHLLGAYVQDASHFLAMLERRQLQSWLQDLVLYHGGGLKGHIQIFPTMGYNHSIGMGDILCRAIQHEAYFPLDRLRVRLYTLPYQVLRPREMDREGLLTFGVAELVSLLEMVSVFRSMFRPEEQKILYQVLTLNNPAEEQFYWGRLLGMLPQTAKDLLAAWRLRDWPPSRVKFFYELTKYVDFRFFD